MTKMLKSGWWYCNCDVPCNCGEDKNVKKLNPPEIKHCRECKALRREVDEREL